MIDLSPITSLRDREATELARLEAERHGIEQEMRRLMAKYDAFTEILQAAGIQPVTGVVFFPAHKHGRKPSMKALRAKIARLP